MLLPKINTYKMMIYNNMLYAKERRLLRYGAYVEKRCIKCGAIAPPRRDTRPRFMSAADASRQVMQRGAAR